MYLVRYADDFKIFTNSYENARKIKIAVEKWLKERLGLEISEEKSKITNLRKNGYRFSRNSI
ncbi:reverse transcriptase domain-containing protein [Bacillus pacificus]